MNKISKTVVGLSVVLLLMLVPVITVSASETQTDEEDIILKELQELEKLAEESVNSEEVEKLMDSIKEKIETSDIDSDKVLNQAKDLYDKYGKDLVEDSKETIKESIKDTENAVKDSAKNVVSQFFQNLGDYIVEFFKGLFS